MKIKRITSRHRRDFYAECEHCGYIEKDIPVGLGIKKNLPLLLRYLQYRIVLRRRIQKENNSQEK